MTIPLKLTKKQGCRHPPEPGNTPLPQEYTLSSQSHRSSPRPHSPPEHYEQPNPDGCIFLSAGNPFPIEQEAPLFKLMDHCTVGTINYSLLFHFVKEAVTMHQTSLFTWQICWAKSRFCVNPRRCLGR